MNKQIHYFNSICCLLSADVLTREAFTGVSYNWHLAKVVITITLSIHEGFVSICCMQNTWRGSR